MEIAGHVLKFDAAGRLQPWAPWIDILRREMDFYQRCPLEHGYPRFAYTTFLDADWEPLPDRFDTIPATQNGTGILSYLKFHELDGRRDGRLLKTACLMGDYLVKETLTPDLGCYPRFTRSTGDRRQFPLAKDAGAQADRPFEIEPDKGGIAGYALLLLFEATGDGRYQAQALQNARVLAANQQAGDGAGSPWPFRVDYRSGEGRGAFSGNMTYVLRLYDGLLAQGHEEFLVPRRSLWDWIHERQIPNAAADGSHFAQFFEDHDTPTDRTAWAPLNLARYLLEKKDLLASDWRTACDKLIEFVQGTFTHVEYGVTVCHEQDEDREAWGGVNSTYGAVLALYARSIGSSDLAHQARQALNFTLYSIDEQGRPRDFSKNAAPGGWQEDAHTDVIHNYVDALRAFPEWAGIDIAHR
jgi:hypothetical protein